MRGMTVVASLIYVVVAGPAGGQATFEGLGDLPGGEYQSRASAVSADGSVVVGNSSSSTTFNDGFRWENGVMTQLGDLPGGSPITVPGAVSADGSVIVGMGNSTLGSEAFRWVAPGTMTGLGTNGGISSSASDVSDDGSIVVGRVQASGGESNYPFRWQDGVMSPLPGASFKSHAGANAVSADGSVVVGGGLLIDGVAQEAFRWEDGVLIGLGHLGGTHYDFWSTATDVTPDGSVVVGRARSALGGEAFRWENNVMFGLGDLGTAPGSYNSFGYAVSADGSVIVGTAGSGDPFIWNECNGMRYLRDVLVDEYGLDLTGWDLATAHGVSADGRTIVGWGLNPDGNEEGWIATLPATNGVPKLTASDGAEFDAFGSLVAVSGDTAVVGAFYDDDGGDSSGSAYVFRYDGSDWVEEAKLTASDAAEFDFFGISVAVSGDTTVVGAFGDDDNGDWSGAAYVFRYDGSDWVEEAKLTASDAAAEEFFGRSVAVSGDTVLAGAYSGDNDNGDLTGAAYVFRYDGSDWVEEAKLTASDGAEFDYFGYSFDVSGDTIVVGAYHDDDNGDSSGSAYVFRYDGSDWIEEAKLTASDGAESDHFGELVALSGDAVVVGAQGDDDNGDWSGSAYVFRYDGSDWIEEAKLIPSDGAEGERFGRSVAVSGDTAVVGTHLNDHNGIRSGSAYVFRYDGSDWVEQTKLTPFDGEADDRFGISVAVSGDTAVVGANGDRHSGTGTGSAYVFPIIPPVCGDGFDNDGDGLIDYAEDPECTGREDVSEGPDCQDGVDNDGDGFVDFPGDPGCFGTSGAVENPACDDKVDNDGDTFVDFPADPGCAAAFLDNEAPACDDKVDNDGDGAIDYPVDIGCRYASSTNESPACSDGIDNDSDGEIDWAGGPGGEPPDTVCQGKPWKAAESGCGLGAELALLMPMLWWLRKRRLAARS